MWPWPQGHIAGDSQLSVPLPFWSPLFPGTDHIHPQIPSVISPPAHTPGSQDDAAFPHTGPNVPPVSHAHSPLHAGLRKVPPPRPQGTLTLGLLSKKHSPVGGFFVPQAVPLEDSPWPITIVATCESVGAKRSFHTQHCYTTHHSRCKSRSQWGGLRHENTSTCQDMHALPCCPPSFPHWWSPEGH